VNSVWLLDDFTPENGPTRLVPGTHVTGQVPKQVLADADAPHPSEIKVTAPAGSVLVFNGHLWHGGTQNHSDKLRRSMHSTFIIRSVKQLVDQKAHLRPETNARLSAAARYILDV
jgi:ectoine hydroxylase-related dioxygenase (phytanoyl-CoA dioxygenase family)